MNDEDYAYIFKLVIIGDSGVGKSNIFTRFIQDEFNTESRTTIGVEFSAKTVTIRNKVIKTQVWDTAGQDRFRALARSYYRGAVGALLVYDISSYDSFKNIHKWLDEVKEYADENLVVLLIGNKSDLEEIRAVKTEEGTAFAESQGIGFLETSAKSNLHIEEAFTRLVGEVVEKLEKISDVPAEPNAQQDKKEKKDTKNNLNAGVNLQLDNNNHNIKKGTKDENCAC